MTAPAIATTVAALVDDITDQVISTLGASYAIRALDADGVRHVLRLQVAKVVADYLRRSATQ